MINVETLTANDIIASYERIGYTLMENYTSVTIRQLKFKRGNIYVEFFWKANKWDFPLRHGDIDVCVIGEASYSSIVRWAKLGVHILPKELLYEASITIDSPEKLVIYLNNALTERAIEELE